MQRFKRKHASQPMYPGARRRVLVVSVAASVVGIAAVVAALCAGARQGPGGGSATLMGDDIAAGAMQDMHMLAQAKKKAAAGGQITAAQPGMSAFVAKFDKAFNEGWKDAGKKAREVRWCAVQVHCSQSLAPRCISAIKHSAKATLVHLILHSAEATFVHLASR